MLGRYKTQGNYRYKAFDEYRYGHGALLALGHIRAGECIVMEHLLISCATGSGHIRMKMNTGYGHCALLALGHIRTGENNDKGSLLMSCAAGSGHIRAGENNDKGSRCLCNCLKMR